MSFLRKRQKFNKLFCLLLCIIVLFAFTGCLKTSTSPGDNSRLDGAGNSKTPGEEPKNSVEDYQVSESKQTDLEKTGQCQAVIYRLTTDGDYLLPITRTVKSDGDVLDSSLQELFNWQDEWSKPLLPEEIKFKKAEVQRGIAFINLTGDFEKINVGSGGEARIIDGLVRTATQFPQVKQAMILLNGEKAETLAGHVAIDHLLSPNPYINFINDEHPEGIKIQLYFSDSNGMYMIPVTYSVPKTTGVARAALEQLIKGPNEPGLNRTIPKGVKLLGIELEKGIAKVNFSRELSTNHWGGSSGESATISSIVYTLTALQGIDKVQILIEGKTGETIAGHVILDQPFGRGNVNFRG